MTASKSFYIALALVLLSATAAPLLAWQMSYHKTIKPGDLVTIECMTIEEVMTECEGGLVVSPNEGCP